MIIESISFQGFRSFRDEVVMQLPKNPGVFLITGENQVEPELGANGVGKSSFAEGLCWCFFDKTSKGHRAKDVSNWSGEYLTAVSLNFRDDCGDNTLTRRWNPNAFVHQIEECEPKTIEKHDVEKILGLNYKLFLATVLFSQSGGTDKKDSPGKHFMELGPTAQAEALSDVLNLSVWEERAKKAKTKASESKLEWEELDQEVQGLKAKRVVLVSEYNDFVDKEETWDGEQELAEKRLCVQLNEAEVLRAEKRCAEDEAKHKKQSIGDESESTQKRIDRLQKSISRYEKKVQAFRVQEAVVVTKIKVTTKEQDQQTELVELGKAACPRCGKSLDPINVQADLKLIESSVVVLKDDLDALRIDLRRMADVVDRLTIEHDAFEEKCEAADIQKEDAVDHYQDCVNACQRADKAVVIIETQIKGLKKEENPHTATIDELDQKIDVLAHEIKHGVAECRRSEVLADRYGYWAQGFLRIRLWLLERAMSEFEAKMLNSFDLLGLRGWSVACETEKELKSGGTKAALTILVSSPESPEPVPWGVWSGGEEQRLKLAGSAAFCDLVCDRMGVRPSLEIWDEPTQHLSPEGCEDLMEFFQHRSRMLKKQVWVIDHRTTNSGEVDGHWHFVKTKQGTRVTELQ